MHGRWWFAATIPFFLAACDLLFPFRLAGSPPPGLDGDRGRGDGPTGDAAGERASPPAEAGVIASPVTVSDLADDASSPVLASFKAGSPHQLAVAWVANSAAPAAIKIRLVGAAGDLQPAKPMGPGTSPSLASDGQSLLLVWQVSATKSCSHSLSGALWENNKWATCPVPDLSTASLEQPSVILDDSQARIVAVRDLANSCPPLTTDHLFVASRKRVAPPCEITKAYFDSPTANLAFAVLGPRGTLGKYPLVALQPAGPAPLAATLYALDGEQHAVETTVAVPVAPSVAATPPSIARHAQGWLIAVVQAGGTTQILSVDDSWTITASQSYPVEKAPSLACCADPDGKVAVLATVAKIYPLVLRKITIEPPGMRFDAVDLSRMNVPATVGEPSVIARVGAEGPQYALAYTVGQTGTRRVQLIRGKLP